MFDPHEISRSLSEFSFLVLSDDQLYHFLIYSLSSKSLTASSLSWTIFIIWNRNTNFHLPILDSIHALMLKEFATIYLLPPPQLELSYRLPFLLWSSIRCNWTFSLTTAWHIFARAPSSSAFFRRGPSLSCVHCSISEIKCPSETQSLHYKYPRGNLLYCCAEVLNTIILVQATTVQPFIRTKKSVKKESDL